MFVIVYHFKLKYSLFYFVYSIGVYYNCKAVVGYLFMKCKISINKKTDTISKEIYRLKIYTTELNLKSELLEQFI